LLCECICIMDASSPIYAFAFLKSSTPSVTLLLFHNSIFFRVLLTMKLFYKIEVLLETVSPEMTLPTCSMHFVIYQNNAYPNKFPLFDDDKLMTDFSFLVSLLFWPVTLKHGTYGQNRLAMGYKYCTPFTFPPFGIIENGIKLT